MPNLLVGATIRPADFPPAVFDQDTTTISNITQTTPAITGSPVVDVLWTAPTSGRVILVIGVGARGAGGGRVLAVPETFQGVDASGTSVIANNQNDRYGVATPHGSTDHAYFSRRTLLTGLTPEASYYTRFVYWADVSGFADIVARDLTVCPTT